jgi:predicted Zn-ribbon and HTH transcriptional regulator
VERRCEDCDFTFPANRPGGVFYVLDESNERIMLSYGSEISDALELTGVAIKELEPTGRLGYLSDCVCKGCFHQFALDLDRDVKQCPHCESIQVVSARGAVGAPCPSCQRGIVREFELDST